MSRRSKAREVALQMLFQVDMNPDVDGRMVAEMVRELLSEVDLREMAIQLFDGTLGRRDELDARIQAIATNWKLFRMAATDRNVLRLGAYEILHSDTPRRVAIDEALELAKKFGSEQSSQFVNGILDKLDPNATEPVGEPTEPAVETTEPAVETTEPAVEPTEPAVETTEPAAEATGSDEVG